MTRKTCDVVVIGAGMAGASVAAELSSRVSVVIAEAEASAGAHSTGRSAAAYLPSYGGPTVRAFTAASRPLYDSISQQIGEELLPRRWLIWLGTDAAGEAAVADISAQNPDLGVLTPAQAVELFPPLRLERVVAAALDSSATDIDVARLHQHYLSLAKRLGGETLLHAPVSSIRRWGSGWEVQAGDHVISCASVVNAAGAWADEVARLAGVPTIGLSPKRRTAFVSPTNWPGRLADLPLVNDACERWYVKPEAGLILGSPADEADTPPGDAKPDELALAQAIERINEVTTLGLRSVKRAWAGLRSFVADRSPVVGEWQEHRGFIFMAGQGGYGIQMAPALARAAADIVIDGRLSEASSSFGATIESLSPERLAHSRQLLSS